MRRPRATATATAVALWLTLKSSAPANSPGSSGRPCRPGVIGTRWAAMPSSSASSRRSAARPATYQLRSRGARNRSARSRSASLSSAKSATPSHASTSRTRARTPHDSRSGSVDADNVIAPAASRRPRYEPLPTNRSSCATELRTGGPIVGDAFPPQARRVDPAERDQLA